MTYDERINELLNELERDGCVTQEEYVRAMRRWKDVLDAHIEHAQTTTTF